MGKNESFFLLLLASEKADEMETKLHEHEELLTPLPSIDFYAFMVTMQRRGNFHWGNWSSDAMHFSSSCRFLPSVVNWRAKGWRAESRAWTNSAVNSHTKGKKRVALWEWKIFRVFLLCVCQGKSARGISICVGVEREVA